MQASVFHDLKLRKEGNASDAFHFVALEAACADIARLHFAVLRIGHLLHVGGKRPLCLTMGVADVVARRLALSANGAYSRHISTSRGKNLFCIRKVLSYIAIIIPFYGGKSN